MLLVRPSPISIATMASGSGPVASSDGGTNTVAVVLRGGVVYLASRGPPHQMTWESTFTVGTSATRGQGIRHGAAIQYDSTYMRNYEAYCPHLRQLV
jgi:hypothetical protein